MTTKKIYDERKAAGNCVKCGKPASGRVHCGDCVAAMTAPEKRLAKNANRKQQRQTRAAAGQCISCKNARDGEAMRCAACQAKAPLGKKGKKKAVEPVVALSKRPFRPGDASALPQLGDLFVLPPDPPKPDRVPTFDDFEAGREPSMGAKRPRKAYAW